MKKFSDKGVNTGNVNSAFPVFDTFFVAVKGTP